MCEFHESTCNGLGDIWWTDNPIYFNSIDMELITTRSCIRYEQRFVTITRSRINVSINNVLRVPDHLLPRVIKTQNERGRTLDFFVMWYLSRYVDSYLFKQLSI